MVFVNPEGSAILGPGSEWFWAMAQFIVVVVTLFAIYRQLRTQAAANALAQVESLDRWYRSREMAVAELQAAIDLRRGVAPPQVDARMLVIAQFFEYLWHLRQSGFIGLREIDEWFGARVQIWWRLLRPVIERSRQIEGEPRLFEGLEKLDGLCGTRALERGSPRAYFLDVPPESLLDEVIERRTDYLRLLNDVASDLIPPATGDRRQRAARGSTTRRGEAAARPAHPSER